jgi:hypothetical protein
LGTTERKGVSLFVQPLRRNLHMGLMIADCVRFDRPQLQPQGCLYVIVVVTEQGENVKTLLKRALILAAPIVLRKIRNRRRAS